MVASLPDTVIQWISETLTLDEMNVSQLKRHGTHALKVTDLKTLSYKIDKELSDYCRNNNTTDTVQEDRLVAAFGGERFHRPPSNAKKDAWIRYVQTCFYKDNLKSILVSKDDIIWKALNLEPPPECTSHIENVSYGPHNSETTKVDDQQSVSSPMQFHRRIAQAGNYRDEHKKEGNNIHLHRARHEYHQNKSLNGPYGQGDKKDLRLNYESRLPNESSSAEIERRRSLLKRKIDAEKDQLYSQLHDGAGEKKRNILGHFSSDERTLLHQANQNLVRDNQVSDNTVALTQQLRNRDSLMLGQNPHLGDTDILLAQRRQELSLLGSAHQQSNSLLQRSYLDLLRERTQRIELLQQQQNNFLLGSRLAPTLQTSHPVEGGLSTAALHEKIALQRQGESLLSQRNVAPSVTVSLNNTDLGLASLSSASLLGGSVSIGDATRRQQNLDHERALLLEQLMLQRRQEELLYQSATSGSSVLTPSIPRSSSNAQSFLIGSGFQQGRGSLDENKNLSTSMTSGLLTGGQQDLNRISSTSASTMTASTGTAARMTENSSMRLSSSVNSSRSLDQMMLLAGGQEITAPGGISDFPQQSSLQERIHQEQELLRKRQQLLSASSISEEAAALQRSARNQAILRSLDERQYMIEKQLLETKTGLSSASMSSYLATAGMTEQQKQQKQQIKESRITSLSSTPQSHSSKKGSSQVIRRKSNMTRSRRSELSCGGLNENSVNEVDSIVEDSSSSKLKASASTSGSIQHGQKNSPFSSQSSEEIGAPTIVRNKTPSIVTTSTQIQSEHGSEKIRQEDLS